MTDGIAPAARPRMGRWLVVAIVFLGFLGQLFIQSQTLPDETPRLTIQRLTGIDIAAPVEAGPPTALPRLSPWPICCMCIMHRPVTHHLIITMLRVRCVRCCISPSCFMGISHSCRLWPWRGYPCDAVRSSHALHLYMPFVFCRRCGDRPISTEFQRHAVTGRHFGSLAWPVR